MMKFAYQYMMMQLILIDILPKITKYKIIMPQKHGLIIIYIK